MTRRFDAVIFDFDGTIADTLDICVEAFQNTVELRAKRRPTDAEVRAGFGASEEGILRRLLGDDHDIDSAILDYVGEYEQLHDRVAEPFAGITPLLDHLQDVGHRLAIVTGKGPQTAAVSARRMDLHRWFEAIEAGSPEGNIKHECIARLLAAWSLPAHRVAYIGDAGSDAESAKLVGVTMLGAAWAPGTDRQALIDSGSDEVFDTVGACAAWLGHAPTP